MTTVLGIVSYNFLPAKVGGQKGVAYFHKYFSRWQKDILVTTVNNDVAAAEGYEVLPILSASPVRYIHPGYIFRLRRLIRERRVTHFMLEHPYYGWLGVALKWITGVRLIVHSHNLEGLRWKGLGKWWWKILWHYEKWTHRRADYNFFITAEDMEYGIRHWRLDPARCIVMTYGFERERIPSRETTEASRAAIRARYELPADMPVLLFNGAFKYAPNANALEHLLRDINPLLQDCRYRLIICGKDIPEQISGQSWPNVIFAGFVDDIEEYLRSADVFLNPIVDGGGIKTKLVEALGNNVTTVSVRNGAIGVDPAICNGKLLVCENDDWTTFAKMTKEAIELKSDVPSAFFSHFYWGDATKRAAAFISQ